MLRRSSCKPSGAGGGFVAGLVLQFTLSAVAIFLSGIFLTRATDEIAELTNFGRLLAGSLFLASASSLPNLFVDISAIQSGMPDLAVGDLVGNNLMDLLILAIADLLHRAPRKIFSRASAAHALSAVLSMALAAIAAMSIFLGPFIRRYEIFSIGMGPLLIAISYVLGLRLIYRNQKPLPLEGSSDTQVSRNRKLVHAISIYLVCAVVTFIAAPFLAEAAGQVSDRSGLGKSFIGSSLVALCTSLPELVTTISAVRMRAFDLAVGNIFGSNSFNMILLVPLDFFQGGALFAMLSRVHVFTLLAMILGTCVAIMGQLYQVEERKKFIEPDAFMVIVIVLGTLAVLFFTGIQ